MSAWVELNVQGGARAFVEAASVKALVLGSGASSSDIPDAKTGIQIVLGDGSILPPVIGISADNLILSLGAARAYYRMVKKPAFVLYEENLEVILGELARGGELRE